MAREYSTCVDPRALIKLLAQLHHRGWIERRQSENGDMFYQMTDEGERALLQQRVDIQKRSERIGSTGQNRLFEERYIRWVCWLLCWYPSAWRERYEQEMLALLEQHTITLLTLLDLWLGALDAHLKGGYYRVHLSFFFKDLQATVMLFIGAAALFFFVLPFRDGGVLVVSDLYEAFLLIWSRCGRSC
jgi:hypothetical protein